MEVIGFSRSDVYSLKLKPGIQPPTATTLSTTKGLYDAMLFSPNFSDVLFVCPDGSEIHAHRCVLAAKNPYFQSYFSGPWLEQHPDGRWQTENSADVVKAMLSLIYTGDIPCDATSTTILELLKVAYEFQLDDDLLRVCQSNCIEIINETNVKDQLLSSKLLGASFLFHACFKFASKHFIDLASDLEFVGDIINADPHLWQEIVKSSPEASRKRKRMH